MKNHSLSAEPLLPGHKNCLDCPLKNIGKKRRNCNVDMCDVMTHAHTQTDVDFFLSFHRDVYSYE